MTKECAETICDGIWHTLLLFRACEKTDKIERCGIFYRKLLVELIKFVNFATFSGMGSPGGAPHFIFNPPCMTAETLC